MAKFIDTLKSKSEREKKQFAFAIALAFALLIFAVWVTVIYPDFRNKQQNAQVSSTQDTTPLKSMSETFITGIASFKTQIMNIKNRLIPPPEASVEAVASSSENIPTQPIPVGY